MENLIPIIIVTPMLISLISYFVGKKNQNLRNLIVSLTTFGVFALAILMFNSNLKIEFDNLFSLGISFFADGFRSVLVILTSFIWFIVSLVSKEYFKNDEKANRFYSVLLFTLGATLGVFLSNDLFTTFIMFELMSFASVLMVIHEETKEAIKSAKTYLSVGVICGMITLIGILIMYNHTNTLNFNDLHNFISTNGASNFYLPAFLILVGFAAKAGLVPLHFWMPNSYKDAATPGTTILSAIISKTGVFGILVLMCQVYTSDQFFGFIILVLGLATAILGGILALFSVNLKHLLACSSMSQIGFIVIGVGMQGLLGNHNEIASAGTVLYIINHSIFKTILFSFSGIVYLNTRDLNLNKIKGFGKGKPLLHIIFVVAALGIMGVPLFSGYVSKVLVHESIVEYIHILSENGLSTVLFRGIEYLFLFAGGLTIAYMLKIYFALFIDGEKQKNKKYSSLLTLLPLLLLSVVVIIFGVNPNLTMDKIAQVTESFMYSSGIETSINYFGFVNLQGILISLVIGIVIYIFFVNGVLIKTKNEENKYLDKWPKKLNIQKMVYDPLFLVILPNIGAFFARIIDYSTDTIVMIVRENIFYKDESKKEPQEDNYFATYDKRSAPKNINVKDSLSKSLLFIALGILIAVVFMLL